MFQLAFILAHIPTLTSRMTEFKEYQNPTIDEDAASLLYFPTGGGKSEAFYGTLLFAMFVDRLRGKSRGVTAMIRYPLRLLTLQQGQRLLKLIAHAEIVRRSEQKRDGFIGQWPFEIGFWVGGTNTPNRYAQVPAVVPLITNDEHPNDEGLEEGAKFESDKLRKDAARYREFRSAYNKVPECPVCNSPTGLRRFEAEDETTNILGIVCFNSKCNYNITSAVKTHLPFLLTDDTIYQRAPSVILGTIDKMAMLGHRTSTIRQLIGMFGLARAVAPSGHLNSPWIENGLLEKMHDENYREVFPAFKNGEKIFYDPFPSLIIQDEAHLLEESLGTFSGLFDTLFETILRKISEIAGNELSVSKVWDGKSWGGPRLPKVIAATATISNPDRQLEVLYQRRVLRFPYPGSDIYRSFFAQPEKAPVSNLERTALEERRGIDSSPELTAPWMRLFVSIMTNNFTHTVTTVTVLGAFHTIVTELWRGMLDEAKRDVTMGKLLNAQGSDLTSGWRRSAIERAIGSKSHADIMALIDLHRIALAYVTNKKGGDQVMDALASAVKQQHRLSHQVLEKFESSLISGGIDMKEIQEIMEEAEKANPDKEYEDLQRLLRSIVATSAISHGVDVDRFNSMFFAGLPSDIAEYIQASSRVGRTHVGFVVLVPTPQSRRDRYVVETHDIFHRFLERMIAPPAVERWAENALKRVMASLVQAWASLKEAQLFLSAPDDAKDRVDSYDVTSAIAGYAKRDLISFTDEIGSFVLRAIGFEGRGEARYGSPIYSELYRSLVEQEIMNFGKSMRKLNTSIKFHEYWKDSGASFKPPMTSLRDVDEAGVITGGGYDMSAQSGQRKINMEQLIAVMRAIRSQRGTVSEMDLDTPEEFQA